MTARAVTDLGRGARVMERRRIPRRRLAAIAVLPVLGAMAFGVSALGSGDDGRPLVTGFELADGRTADGLIRLRRERDLALVVHGGSCRGDDGRTPEERLDRVERREISAAVMAAACG